MKPAVFDAIFRLAFEMMKTGTIHANSDARISTFGVPQLTLGRDSYSWAFLTTPAPQQIPVQASDWKLGVALALPAMFRLAVLFLLILPVPLLAQVKVTRILDTPETRVAQVEIPANDTRPLHTHPEALWHVYVTTDAPMDLLIEGQPTVHLGPWQAYFFKGGTSHGFHNPNDRTVRWIEVFALKSGSARGMDENAARALAMALARQ